MKAALIALALLAMLMIGLVLYPVVWMAAGINGRVVDEVTGEPIRDAVVVATWTVKGLEGYPVRQLAIAEAVTGASGRFALPGWGPRFHTGDGRVTGEQPVLRVLAAGYLPHIVSNASSIHSWWSRVSAPIFIRFQESGTTFALKRAADDKARLDDAMTGLISTLEFAYRGTSCEWKQIPRMMRQVHESKLKLQADGLGARLPLLDDLGGQDHCGSAQDYVRVNP